MPETLKTVSFSQLIFSVIKLVGCCIISHRVPYAFFKVTLREERVRLYRILLILLHLFQIDYIQRNYP
jgi:hypothetical protein